MFRPRIILAGMFAGATLAAGVLFGAGTADAACMGNGIDDITFDKCTPKSSGSTQQQNTGVAPRAVPSYDDDGNVTGYSFDSDGDGKATGDDTAAERSRDRTSRSTADSDN